MQGVRAEAFRHGHMSCRFSSTFIALAILVMLWIVHWTLIPLRNVKLAHKCVFGNEDEEVKPAPVTFGVNLYKVKYGVELNKTIFCISTWLWATPASKVIIYNPEEEIGEYANYIYETLRARFGDRVRWNKKLIHRYHILSTAELFEALQNDADTDLVASINADMILTGDNIKAINILNHGLKDYSNWSVCFGRKNIPTESFNDLQYVPPDKIEETISYVDKLYDHMPQDYGFDIFFWNKKGINMTNYKAPPFFIGHLHYEYWFLREVQHYGVFIHSYPYLNMLHIDHPERAQWYDKQFFPDCVWNTLIQHSDRSFLSIGNEFLTNYLKPDFGLYTFDKKCINE